MTSRSLSQTCRTAVAGPSRAAGRGRAEHAAPATIWVGQGRALSIGPGLNLDPHFGAVACLVIGVDAPFTLCQGGGYSPVVTRTALVPARLRHQVIAAPGVMAFCYLDPGSTRAASIGEQMSGTVGQVLVNHIREVTLLRVVRELALGSATALVDELFRIAGPAKPVPVDERVRVVARLIRDDPQPTLPIGELAAQVYLSPSRLQRLFQDQTGTTLRRYRLWARMVAVAQAMPRWHQLTAAAVEAGFANPSHFSRACREMFGIVPSQLLAAGTAIVPLDGDAA